MINQGCDSPIIFSNYGIILSGLGKLKEGHRKAFGNVQPQKGKIEPKYPHLKDGEIDTVSVEERIERAHMFSELPVKLIKRITIVGQASVGMAKASVNSVSRLISEISARCCLVSITVSC